MHYPLVPLPPSIDYALWGLNLALSAFGTGILVIIGVMLIILSVAEIEKSNQSRSFPNALFDDSVGSLKNGFILLGVAVLISVLGLYIIGTAVVAGVLWLGWKTLYSIIRGFLMLFGLKPDSSIIKWYNRIDR